MEQLDRRTFLTRSSLLAAAAGAAAVVPAALTALSADAPELDAATDTAAEGDAELGAADAGTTLVAHVRDLSTGEIGVFNGTREVVIQNQALARTLYQASR
jgi:hypothetical protein